MHTAFIVWTELCEGVPFLSKFKSEFNENISEVWRSEADDDRD